ncbi:hypothetical protein PVAG01_08605 [Phlyctema vagabunda]|uniref:Uncharacterized protein n=1 Tax=Phlyctema vagabunda TaxID=108571 RepID=A0ABR4P9V3_9HELO
MDNQARKHITKPGKGGIATRKCVSRLGQDHIASSTRISKPRKANTTKFKESRRGRRQSRNVSIPVAPVDETCSSASENQDDSWFPKDYLGEMSPWEEFMIKEPLKLEDKKIAAWHLCWKQFESLFEGVLIFTSNKEVVKGPDESSKPLLNPQPNDGRISISDPKDDHQPPENLGELKPASDEEAVEGSEENTKPWLDSKLINGRIAISDSKDHDELLENLGALLFALHELMEYHNIPTPAA